MSEFAEQVPQDESHTSNWLSAEAWALFDRYEDEESFNPNLLKARELMLLGNAIEIRYRWAEKDLRNQLMKSPDDEIAKRRLDHVRTRIADAQSFYTLASQKRAAA